MEENISSSKSCPCSVVAVNFSRLVVNEESWGSNVQVAVQYSLLQQGYEM
jgi:hypothetical protein